MEARKMRIEEVDGDGNCLFRAVAYQMYGDVELHEMVREKCMDYILANRNQFIAFIDTDEDETIEEYCDRKRKLKIWGDNLEIQALAEMYDRQIELYSYTTEPMLKFHEQSEDSLEPIRISYHGKNHYNAVVLQEWDPVKDNLIDEEAGQVEDWAIQQAEEKNMLN